MKKLCVLLCFLLVLAGCSQQTFETVTDLHQEGPLPQAKSICLDLPQEAASPAMESEENGKLYLCEGYSVAVQTLSGGDLDGTLRQLTGFSRDALTVMERNVGGVSRYDCVWTAVGEEQDQVCRCMVMDDGSYHYAVTVMADSNDAGKLQETWQSLLGSVYLQ